MDGFTTIAPGLVLVDKSVIIELIDQVKGLRDTVVSTAAELKDSKKPYLTAQELMEFTGFGKTWVNDNKQDIGFSIIGGCLRFKRKDVEDFMNSNYFKAKKPKFKNY